MSPSPQEIRTAKSEATVRDRDLAASLNISEAQLVAAHVGASGPYRATRIKFHPDEVMPAISQLGEVMEPVVSKCRKEVSRPSRGVSWRGQKKRDGPVWGRPAAFAPRLEVV